MKIIEQSAEILDWRLLDLYRRVETAARVCRQSESNGGDAAEFVRRLIKRGHFSPLEFARIKTGQDMSCNVRRLRETARDSMSALLWIGRLQRHYPALVEDLHCPPEESGCIAADNSWIPVLITTSRTISHQLVRYRHEIVFMQESQRYCRYDESGIEVIVPPHTGSVSLDTLKSAVRYAEESYRILMHQGARAEQARAVLPGCTATRILVYASPAEWRHIFGQRCDKHADPQMQALMYPLRDAMDERGLI